MTHHVGADNKTSSFMKHDSDVLFLHIVNLNKMEHSRAWCLYDTPSNDLSNDHRGMNAFLEKDSTAECHLIPEDEMKSIVFLLKSVQ